MKSTAPTLNSTLSWSSFSGIPCTCIITQAPFSMENKKFVEKMEVGKPAPTVPLSITSRSSNLKKIGQNLKPRPICHYYSDWMHRGGPHTCKAYYGHFPSANEAIMGNFSGNPVPTGTVSASRFLWPKGTCRCKKVRFNGLDLAISVCVFEALKKIKMQSFSACPTDREQRVQIQIPTHNNTNCNTKRFVFGCTWTPKSFDL